MITDPKRESEDVVSSWLAIHLEQMRDEDLDSSISDRDLSDSEILNTLDRAENCAGILRAVWPDSDQPGSPTAETTRVVSDHVTDLEFDLPQPSLPSAFGRFRIQKLIGRGGMGSVFLANDPTLNRSVALKVPRFDLASEPDLRQRFLREAQTAARFNHPNLVSVFEAGMDGSVCYIASEYCEGTDLSRWLKQQTEPVDPRKAVRLMAQVADAVHYCHQNNVIHRDLKPSNILLVASEEAEANGDDEFCFVPKITDFGLARAQDIGESDTRTSLMMGTPLYMAPEQVESRRDQIGPATDVYALGVILYELLAGRPPFTGESTVAILDQVRHTRPTSLKKLRRDIPTGLDHVCSRCLQKDPSQRYANAGELCADLHQILSDEPVVPIRLRRKLLIASAAGIVLLIAGFVAINGGITGNNHTPSNRTTNAEKGIPEHRSFVGENNEVGIDYALEFDGWDDFVDVPSLKYDGSHPLTIEAYVTPQELGVSPAVASMGGIVLNINHERKLWNIVGTSAKNQGFVFARPDAPVSLGRRIHLCGIWDLKELRTFIDGQLLARQSVEGGLFFSNAPLFIAADAGGPPERGGYFNGTIDELRISNTGRYTEEFTPAQRFTPDEYTLVLYHFDEGDGEVLTDSSGNEYHGRIRGANWVKAGPSAVPTEASKAITTVDAPPLARAPFDADQALGHQQAWASYLGTDVETTNSIGMQMRLIPPGEFLMGSADSDDMAEDHEKPQHLVKLTKAFLISVHEVTRGQFRAFVEVTDYKTDAEKLDGGTGYLPDGEHIRDPKFLWSTNPGFEQTDDHPVVNVSWNDARAFCEWLSEQEGVTYQLPTEAQWEYACRAGSTTRFSFGDDETMLDLYCWYGKNGGNRTEPIGLKRPNSFGLFDMNGNVDEWCLDSQGPYVPGLVDPLREGGFGRVYRGGKFYDWASRLRSAYRGYYLDPKNRAAYLGFRVTRIQG